MTLLISILIVTAGAVASALIYASLRASGNISRQTGDDDPHITRMQ